MLLPAHNCLRTLWGEQRSKGQQWQPSGTPWATRGNQTWSGVWQKLQQKGSNWQCAGEGREPMGATSQEESSATSPPVVASQQCHGQLAAATSGHPAAWHEGFQGHGEQPRCPDPAYSVRDLTAQLKLPPQPLA